MQKTFYSVSEITRYIKSMMDTDVLLSNTYIQGEVSNVKYHYSGHVYFTLKDENAVIKAVMFKSRSGLVPFNLENGMKVIVRGYISVYEGAGQYQIYVDAVKKQGTGDLYEAFEKLKAKLESEGLFDIAHKKKLPFLPETIAVVTSATGSVIRDIIHVLGRRYPNFHLLLYPVRVQGKEASGEISDAIQTINERRLADVIILARGGGSIEELWPFNEESTARSIFASEIPVISAIGHETDFTIADFVADHRAPTPSAAAEIVMPDKDVVVKAVKDKRDRLVSALLNQIRQRRKDLDGLSEERLKMPLLHRLDQHRLKCDHAQTLLVNRTGSLLRENRNKLDGLVGQLEAFSPAGTVKRGFALVLRNKDKQLVKRAVDTKEGDVLDILLTDGIVRANVLDINISDEKKLFAGGLETK